MAMCTLILTQEPQVERMSLLNAALFAIYLLSALGCDASALTNYPDQGRISLPNLRHSNTALQRRVLKSKDADNVDTKGDIERAYIPGLSPIAGAVSKISPSAQKLANKLWLQSKTDPELVFNVLHLGEAAAKLDNNPRFLLWLKYVDMYANLKFRSFSDHQIVVLLRKSHSDEKLVTLSQSLRRIPARKNLAEMMQRYLIEDSASSRPLLIAAWRESLETPDEVFKILYPNGATLPADKLPDNSQFLQWFKYTETYWPVDTRDLSTFKFLEQKFGDSDMHIALLFQAVKQRQELETLGDSLQSLLFNTWVDKKFTPGFVQSQLALPWGIAIFKLGKGDVFYRALEEYTIHYTGKLGGKEVLKTVRGLFANDKPDEALAIATNLARNQ
ncbi:hypothetical protein PHYSODRAFT_285571 [Phytophthora sojae]|uniref:Uncharacterized protein n=2 Tax=Phytophthora sojae TaxID=67593 RepID=G4ZA51_PHYSP|nr:hypothetical protein PHYSODRAFT_285571 [Phytophthora sojae]EGZ21190.1 hypothetical protein PHYSODRAFT_285571 [Phytophthora sojae]|eukprot:XP_009523907.1 hypothetical protein PHYSODRAFT_285571 [Phytophthora sojae]